MSLAYLRARYPAAFAALKHSAAIFEPPSNLNAANNMNAAEAITALENLNPRPTNAMTYQSLTEALARLADDPRIHPSTKIELEVEHEIAHYTSDDSNTPDEIEQATTAEPLVSISIHPGIVRLSSARAEPAAAR